MAQKFYKTTAITKAHIVENGWQPKDLTVLLSAAPGQDMLTKAQSEDFDPQKDLMKVVSVLVSTGMNKNDDVFLAKELANVTKSGAHKPFNIEHNSKENVGHMVRSFATDKSGNEISDISKLPVDFDVTNEAVVYAFQLPDVAKEIKDRASAGQLFVSVEMWFTDYDFMIGNKVFARNQATAFLEESLRANGGDGTFKGERVGRVLRNMLIGGIGFVAKPANPESVIHSVSSLRSEGVRDVSVYDEPALANNIVEELGAEPKEPQAVTEESKMSDKLFEEMAATVKATAEAAAEAAVEKALKKIEAKEKEAQPATATESKEVQVSENADKAVAINENSNPEIQELTTAVKKLTATVQDQAEELEALKQEKTVAARRRTLSDLGLEDATLQKALDNCVQLDGTEFKSFCDLFQDMFNERNLRSQASEDNQTEKGGTNEDSSAKQTSDQSQAANVDDGENAQSSEVSEDDGDNDLLLDMSEAEDVDPDVGAGQAKVGETVVDRMERSVAGRMFKRNKHWKRAITKNAAREREAG